MVKTLPFRLHTSIIVISIGLVFIICTFFSEINYYLNISVVAEGDINEVDFSLNNVALLKERFPQYTGAGIVICQKEHKADPTDIDFINKILPSSVASTQTSPHATAVASIMAGAGFSMPKNQGIAPDAKIIPVSFSAFFPENDKFYTDNGVSIINHSYGNEIDNRYSQEAAEYDAQVSRMPYLVNVFSSGNSGSLVSTIGTYKNIPDFANMTGDYKMSKNTISVGSFLDGDNIAPSSSRGPTYDGRIKPEIITYSSGGTSFSAATVSGVVATLQNAFKDKNNTLPPCSLIKSLLIGTSDDIATSGPDFQSGYGSLNAYEAMVALTNKTYFEGIINQSERKEFTVNIPANVKKAKFTLVWTDPAAKTGSSKALVNDLDFEVNNNNSTWLPWVLSAFPDADSLKKVAIRKTDTINNVEMISIDSPSSGTYTLRVKGSNIVINNQSFHIAYQFEYENKFVWQYPVGKSYLYANAENTIRWKSTLKNESAALHYSTDLGVSWKLISNNLNLQAGQFVWQAPNIYSSVILKITAENQSFLSNTFALVNPLKLNILQNCGDSLSLIWNAASTEIPIQYLIQKLNKNTLQWQDITNTTNTQVTLNNIKTDDWLSVSPLLPSNWTGLRSNAVSPVQTSGYCYYDSFKAYSIDEKTVELSIQLSQTAGVKKILFEKLVNSTYQTIAEQNITPNSLEYSAQDTDLIYGENSYRATIVFTNEKSSPTYVQKLFLFNDSNDVVVYPNPLAANQPLNINLKVFGEYQLDIFTINGQPVFNQILYETENSIVSENLQAGLYIIKIKNIENGTFYTKKLMIY